MFGRSEIVLVTFDVGHGCVECKSQINSLVKIFAFTLSLLQSYEYKDLHVEPSLNDDLRKFIDRIAFAIFSFIFAVFMTIGY